MKLKKLGGFFVTGTDTGVGKTAVCAGLMKRLNPQHPTAYWKPVQTGFPEDDDTQTVHALTGLSSDLFEEPTYRFRLPASPHLAAQQEGKVLDCDRFLQRFQQITERRERVIVEGAGGLFVPYRPAYLQVHLIKALRLPVLIVVADKLGAINHTLLTLEACRKRQIPVAGLILNLADHFEGNQQSLVDYGNTKVLARYFKQGSALALVKQLEADDKLLSDLNSYL